MPITSVGGQQLAGSVSGYLCQICAEAVAHVGSIGPSALEWALVAHLAPEGIGKLDYGQLRVHGLIGWGGLASRAPACRSGESVRDGGGAKLQAIWSPAGPGRAPRATQTAAGLT